MIEPNEHLLAIHRDAEPMDDRGKYVRLDRNERVVPFPQAVFSGMLATLGPETFCAYPDPAPLRRRVAEQLRLPVESVYLTPGSDGAIRMLFHTYVRAGDWVLLPDPTYAMYGIYARIFRASVESVPYDTDLRLDLDRVRGLLKRGPRVFALPNPNQPTGTVVSLETLCDLARGARAAGALMIIDEAYYPFYPETAAGMLQDLDNVVITRTFSKVAGLAGVRIGYLAANPGIVRHVQQVRGAHEVNAVAVQLGSYVLDHPEITAQALAEVEEGRAVLRGVAQELGLGCPPCPTNFQILRFPEGTDTKAVVHELKQRGYLVKGGFTTAAMRNWIRVTLGPRPVMEGFATALRGVARQGAVR